MFDLTILSPHTFAFRLLAKRSASSNFSKINGRRYGYSFGWSGDEANLGMAKSLWGTTWTGTTWWDKPIHQGGPNRSRTLATYQFFPSPLRFTTAAWAQVNWHYDTGGY